MAECGFERAAQETVDQKVNEWTFEPAQVFCIDVVMSTGEGKTRRVEARTTVFKRAVEETYSLKRKSSRTVFSTINQRFPALPFTLRALDETTGRAGIKELVDHNLVYSYPVLYEEKGECACACECAPRTVAIVVRLLCDYRKRWGGLVVLCSDVRFVCCCAAEALVAQFKATALLMPSGNITVIAQGAFDAASFQCDVEVQDEELKTLLAKNIAQKKRKRNKKKKKKK